jgi:hypothetical protein
MQARKKTKRPQIVVPKTINPIQIPQPSPPASERPFSRLSRFFSFLSMKNLFGYPKNIRKLEIEGKLKKMSNDVEKFKIFKDK